MVTVAEKIQAYKELTRFDKPVGIELLLWPTLWAVWLAANLHPTLFEVVIFSLGAILMRSAGCAINDFADRKVDGLVARTKHRPIPSGRVSAKEALAIFVVLVVCSASLLLFLPIGVFYWSFVALFLATLYPFMKRFTYLPQFFLGAAFAWAIPMAYVAAGKIPDFSCWLLYVAYLCWTVAYDTQYAMTDRPDDLKAGIKSTAILFGHYDLYLIALLQIVFIGFMAIVFWLNHLNFIPYISLVICIVLFYMQFLYSRDRLPAHCFAVFKANVWIGRVVWFGLMISAWL